MSDIPYEKHDQILFRFTLEIDKRPREYSLIGKVVKSDLLEGEEQTGYEIRVQFVHINGKDRESIIRYIFEEQRKIRKRSQMRTQED